ncbi:carboxypeptidase-like regulatory domain-containing protein, partial [Ferruginibacter sp.]
MNKFLFLITIFFIFPFIASAQNKTIKGKVTDENGAPLTGVNIIAKNAKKGTQTDKEGNFSITVVAPGLVDLVVSSVGYASKIVTVTGNDAVAVQLIKEAITQEDVVVVGYATIKRKDLTGTVSSVSAKQLKDIPLSSAAEALQGRLAGVQAIASEGAPGADIIIRVRGGGSIT